MHTRIVFLAAVLASSGCGGAKRLASTHAQLQQAHPAIEIHDRTDRCFLASAGAWQRTKVARLDDAGLDMFVSYSLDGDAEATLYVYPNKQGADAHEDHLDQVMEAAANGGAGVEWQYTTEMRITGLPGNGLVGLGGFRLTEQVRVDTLDASSAMAAISESLEPGMTVQSGRLEITRVGDMLHVDVPLHSMAALWTDDAWWYKLRLTWTPQDGEELSDVPVYLLEPLLPHAMVPCELVAAELEAGP